MEDTTTEQYISNSAQKSTQMSAYLRQWLCSQWTLLFIFQKHSVS